MARTFAVWRERRGGEERGRKGALHVRCAGDWSRRPSMRYFLVPFASVVAVVAAAAAAAAAIHVKNK